MFTQSALSSDYSEIYVSKNRFGLAHRLGLRFCQLGFDMAVDSSMVMVIASNGREDN
jgi:hypothetical protein